VLRAEFVLKFPKHYIWTQILYSLTCFCGGRYNSFKVQMSLVNVGLKTQIDIFLLDVKLLALSTKTNVLLHQHH